ncbi:hypothetical protein FPRO05_00408 [Fusarium proliferatum]|uniref:Uncharacterized protein n=1 Tax=Gibberella intermedia TaxID=948311 RepID=A0A365NMJ7_GIBIN|nr:hypothetical protein FPRO05_00408 [Fusarium proliferatum]
MAASTSPDPPLFEPGTRSKISRYAMRYAKQHPGDFLSYLRRVWPEQRGRLVENPGCLRFLGGLKVLLENAETRKIDRTWIPLPELRRLRGRYLLPGEKASFPRLDPPLPEDGTLGEWEFLPQLGCQTASDLRFWVNTLLDVKFNAKYRITSPQRVKDLYLLLCEVYLEAMDGNEGERKVANCIRQDFKNHPYIFCPPKTQWDSAWNYHRDCVWLHGVELPYQPDLSRRYPHLKSFFVKCLGIQELTMNALQKQILEVADDAPAHETLTLMSHLNNLVQNLDELMDPSEFTSKPIFPILTPTGELKRVCGDAAFFIVDDMRLFNLFRDRANMLAFTRSQVMRLEPLFKWLGMQKKYLTVQAKYAVYWPCESKPRVIEWDIGQKAEALLQIAAYFRSCRTERDSDREELLQALRQAEMMEVEDMWSETKLTGIDMKDKQHSPDDPGNVAQDTYPQLKLSTSFGWEESRLVAHVPADKKQQQLAIAVALPRLLMEWLMTSPKYYVGDRGGRVDISELGVSLVKSVLNAPPELANDILETEGIEQPITIQRDREMLGSDGGSGGESATTSDTDAGTCITVQAPPVEIPSEQLPATQAPEPDEDGRLYELVGTAPITETMSRRKILIPHTRKWRPSAEVSASTEPSPFLESTAREMH